MRLAAKPLLAFLFFASYATALRAQAIQIKLVNGKTGRPITDRSIFNVWQGHIRVVPLLSVRIGHVREFPFSVPADKHGVALLRLTDKDSEINVPECKGMQADAEKLKINPNKKDKKEFNKKYKDCTDYVVDNPIVRYADTISVGRRWDDISRTAGGNGRSGLTYIPCWLGANDTWGFTDFSTKDVLQQGVVTANTCGKATASPQSGQLILFVSYRVTGNSGGTFCRIRIWAGAPGHASETWVRCHCSCFSEGAWGFSPTNKARRFTGL